MDIWENMDNLKDSINDMILQRNIAELKIKKALELIEYFRHYCGFDCTVNIHEPQLNELVKVLKGESNNE